MQKLTGRAKLYRHGYVLYRVELPVDFQTARELRGRQVRLYIPDLNIAVETKAHKQTGLNRLFFLIPYEISRRLQIKTPNEVDVEVEVL